MGWKTDLVVNTFKAAVPFRRQMRRLKRALMPYRTNPASDRLALARGLQLIDLLRAAGTTPKGARVLEIGCGWTPIIPLLLICAGAERVIMTDVERLLDRRTLFNAVDVLAAAGTEVAAALRIDPRRVSDRLSIDRSQPLDRLLASFRLTYMVPCDLARLADESLDIVYSHDVLEHIAPPMIHSLLSACRGKLGPDGVMVHIIDNSDHFEHKDKSISRVNFLKFGDFVWSLSGIDRQCYQNRLRHPEYLRLIEGCGYHIVREAGEVDAGALAALPRLRLAERFRGMTGEQLATLTSFVVAARAQALSQAQARHPTAA